MTEILRWFRGEHYTPGLEPDVRWAWVTVSLSALLVAGYVAIAASWYLQSRLAKPRDDRAPLARLGGVVLCCGLCGAWFFLSDMSWPAWRLYDLVLLCLASYTCWFAVRMRGLRPIDERLANVDALKRSARQYRRLALEKETQARQQTFLLNALSHDLRAPLQNVALNAQLLKISTLDAEQLESATVIAENAVAAGHMVNKLLEAAKAGGRDGNAMSLVPVSALVGQIVRRFQPLAEQKGLSLHVATDGDFHVLTDRQKLERIVGNLLDNAIKYTERGGVLVELCRGGEGVRLRVSDTGIGVPQESVSYLFDEFFQVQDRAGDRTQGFGMGLAICRNLARQLGGDVRLARSGPEGSCFEVTIGGKRAPRVARDDTPRGRRPDAKDAGFAPPGGLAASRSVGRAAR